jgi:hypothetical protein
VNVDVLAEYDFIFNDSTTANSPQDSPNQDFMVRLFYQFLVERKRAKFMASHQGLNLYLLKQKMLEARRQPKRITGSGLLNGWIHLGLMSFQVPLVT